MSLSTIITLVVIIVAIKAILPLIKATKAVENKSKPNTKKDLSPEELAKSYESCQTLLTQAELQFFQVLKEVIPSSYHLSAKVRWADVFQVKKGFAENVRHGLFSRIKSKHIDFVLMDHETGQIKCLIELDDASHNSSQSTKRDKFQSELAKACAIPLLRQKYQSEYDTAELKSSIWKAVEFSCDHCGGEMVKRKKTHKSGKTSIFMGCSEYPKCNFTRSIL